MRSLINFATDKEFQKDLNECHKLENEYAKMYHELKEFMKSKDIEIAKTKEEIRHLSFKEPKDDQQAYKFNERMRSMTSKIDQLEQDKKDYHKKMNELYDNLKSIRDDFSREYDTHFWGS